MRRAQYLKNSFCLILFMYVQKNDLPFRTTKKNTLVLFPFWDNSLLKKNIYFGWMCCCVIYFRCVRLSWIADTGGHCSLFLSLLSPPGGLIISVMSEDKIFQTKESIEKNSYAACRMQGREGRLAQKYQNCQVWSNREGSVSIPSDKMRVWTIYLHWRYVSSGSGDKFRILQIGGVFFLRFQQ